MVLLAEVKIMFQLMKSSPLNLSNERSRYVQILSLAKKYIHFTL